MVQAGGSIDSLGAVDTGQGGYGGHDAAGGSDGGGVLSLDGGMGLGGARASSDAVMGGHPGADAAVAADRSRPADGRPNDDAAVTPMGGTGGATVSTGGAGGVGVSAGGSGGVGFQTGGAGGITVSTGGNGGTGSAKGGSGGTSASTGGRGGNTGATSSSSSTSPCAGVVDSSICWELGASGASCATTCAPHGGTSPDAAKHVGTAAQGGSLNECVRLFKLLGHNNTVYSQSLGVGVGCNILSTAPFPYAWISSTDYSDTASAANTRIVCGCRL